MFEPLLLQPKLPNDIHSANDVLEDILDDVDGFPQAALEAAHHFQEELTPTLLEVLDDAIAHYAIATGDDFAPLYALYLLAKFRDTDAYPRLIEILRLPEDGAEIILGEDGLTGYGTVNLIISMFDGDIDVLLGLIEDCNANEFARATGIETLAALYSIQKLRREPLIDYFRRMLASPSTAKYTPFMRGIIASLVIDFNLTELVEVINSAFSNHLIDTEIVGDHKQFMEMMTTHPPLSAEAITKRYHVIEDLTAEMGWWACFHEKPEFFLEPVNVSQKIGRNAPCPCGSGEKYKRCCLQSIIN